MPQTLHPNTSQPPNTFSDTSQVPPNSDSTTTAHMAQISQHTRTPTGPHHSQTAAQPAPLYSSCVEAPYPGPHDVNASSRSHRPKPNTLHSPKLQYRRPGTEVLPTNSESHSHYH